MVAAPYLLLIVWSFALAYGLGGGRMLPIAGEAFLNSGLAGITVVMMVSGFPWRNHVSRLLCGERPMNIYQLVCGLYVCLYLLGSLHSGLLPGVPGQRMALVATWLIIGRMQARAAREQASC